MSRTTEYIDIQYIRLLSPKLEKYKEQRRGLINFRCPVCGDSKKQKNKARGYCFPYHGQYVFKCHNCGLSCSFGNLLRRVDPNLYTNYLTTIFAGDYKSPSPVEEVAKPQPELTYLFGDVHPIAKLPNEHFARKYLVKRCIPGKFFNDLYFTEDFWKLAGQFIETKKDARPDPRIVIPFFDRYKRIIAFQGRSLNPRSKSRYFTIKVRPDDLKVYGLDRVDLSKPVTVVEGPFDSLFLDNCLAIGGADSYHIAMALNLVPERTTFVFDNEPRNPEIVKFMENITKTNYGLFVWPFFPSPGTKDINDIVKRGIQVPLIQKMIRENTHRGLMAKLKLSEWRRV